MHGEDATLNVNTVNSSTQQKYTKQTKIGTAFLCTA